MTPLRGFEDGTRVFLHSYQSFGRGQVSRVCVDVFDTDDDDQLIRRWTITAPLVSVTRSGRSQIDGPTTVTDLERTGENRELVRRYLAEVLAAGRYDRIEEYLDERSYAEHSPEVPDGTGGLRHHLEQSAAAGAPIRYGETILLLGHGDHVVTLSAVTAGTRQYRAFDIYRLSRGRIAEHWDVADR